jgi:hypothetical protein
VCVCVCVGGGAACRPVVQLQSSTTGPRAAHTAFAAVALIPCDCAMFAAYAMQLQTLQKFYVIKYQPGEKYDPHLDPHDESEYGPQKTKRIATVLVYLSDVGSGGETLFPREGKDGEGLPAWTAKLCSCQAAAAQALQYTLDAAGSCVAHWYSEWRCPRPHVYMVGCDSTHHAMLCHAVWSCCYTGSKRPVGIAQCSLGQGLSYKPRRGDAVLFYSTSPDLTLDVRSMHAGCPVGRGSEKWVVTKWLHDKPIVAEGGFGW